MNRKSESSTATGEIVFIGCTGRNCCTLCDLVVIRSSLVLRTEILKIHSLLMVLSVKPKAN